MSIKSKGSINKIILYNNRFQLLFSQFPKQNCNRKCPNYRVRVPVHTSLLCPSNYKSYYTTAWVSVIIQTLGIML